MVIVRYTDNATLMDCEALAVELKRPVSTIRRHCTPIATDPTTGRQLYDRTHVIDALEHVKPRTSGKRAKRS